MLYDFIMIYSYILKYDKIGNRSLDKTEFKTLSRRKALGVTFRSPRFFFSNLTKI